jgi:3-hydroxybutyryl-CoA dehydrogenase/5-formyl-3-hydroxy-2-methylpyridine 4-carboxylate dehydrogenase
MGPGMGAVLARAGMEVTLYDVSEEALGRAETGVGLADGVLDQFGVEPVEGGSVSYVADLEEALDGAEFVAEAIPERLELKHEIFARFEELARPDAILASNTSGIPITKIAEPLARPENVVGMHWSNPPHVIPMIEVIPGDRTSDETTAVAVALVERIGYEAVVEREVPGFVENRILYAIMREAVDLVDRGIIDADGMDRCVRWGIGYKLAVIGPMELLDMAGLDIYQAVGSYLNKDLCNGTEVSKTITDRTAAGNLGMKTGSGLYDYTPERINELRAMRARKLVAVRKALSD